MGDINSGLNILRFCGKGNVLNNLEKFEIYKAFQSESRSSHLLHEKLSFKSQVFLILLDRNATSVVSNTIVNNAEDNHLRGGFT